MVLDTVWTHATSRAQTTWAIARVASTTRSSPQASRRYAQAARTLRSRKMRGWRPSCAKAASARQWRGYHAQDGGYHVPCAMHQGDEGEGKLTQPCPIGVRVGAQCFDQHYTKALLKDSIAQAEPAHDASSAGTCTELGPRTPTTTEHTAVQPQHTDETGGAPLSVAHVSSFRHGRHRGDV